MPSESTPAAAKAASVRPVRRAAPKWAKDKQGNVLPFTGHKKPRGLTVLDWGEWSNLKVEPPEMFLAPVIRAKGLVQVYSPRGVGKTFLGLGMTAAIATGTDFLRWRAAKPRRVLYVDGEMAFYDLQQRANAIVAALPREPEPGFLQLLSADLEPNGIPDLSTEAGQTLIDDALHLGQPDQTDVLLLDNLSTLMRTGTENSDEAWAPVQNWLLRLRRRGVTVVFMHHANKAGGARGTSKREDPLDTVIKLAKPKNYKDTDGARFEVHFEKHRGFYGDDAEPFEVQYGQLEGKALWTWRSGIGGGGELDRIIDLARQGMSVRQIADVVNLKKSWVGAVVQKARAAGQLPPSKDPRKGVRSKNPVPDTL